MADRIRGDEAYSFESSVTQGILLHRFIDNYTDNHEIVKKSKQRLYPEFHKYAPVIVDVFYDHFLAAGFNKYSSETLSEYSQRCYKILRQNIHVMPVRVQQFLPYMIRHNWLTGYAVVEGTGKALAGLASRASFDSKMYKAVYDLIENYDLYQNEFDQFFPDLIKYSKEFLSAIKINHV
jgi:acyl carrier protein phosphodiesterase